jgi:hypothetical protein
MLDRDHVRGFPGTDGFYAAADVARQILDAGGSPREVVACLRSAGVVVPEYTMDAILLTGMSLSLAEIPPDRDEPLNALLLARDRHPDSRERG